MSAASPLVSVIVPNYNHTRFLRQRIDSVLNQTWSALEVVLLDDASTDDSRSVIESYRTDPRVTIHYNAHNSGCVFKQWNKGLALAQGEFVWIAESDDYADPRFLETLVARLQDRPGASLAFCQSYNVDDARAYLDLALWYRERAPQWESDRVIPGLEAITRHFVFQNVIPNTSAVVFRRQSARLAGPADENFKLSGDWVFWVNLLRHGDLIYVAAPLNYYRQGGNARANYLRGAVMIEEALRITVQILRNFPVEPIIAKEATESRIGWFIETMVDPRVELPREQRVRLCERARELDPRSTRRLWWRRSGLGWLWLGVRRRMIEWPKALGVGAPRKETH